MGLDSIRGRSFALLVRIQTRQDFHLRESTSSNCRDRSGAQDQDILETQSEKSKENRIESLFSSSL